MPPHHLCSLPRAPACWLAVAVACAVISAPASAKILKLRMGPGMMSSDIAMSEPASKDPSQTAAIKPAADPANRPEPMSERAKAAAERAARALAEEEGREYDGGATVASDLIDAAEEPVAPKGQPVAAGDRRQKAATSSPSCIAGC